MNRARHARPSRVHFTASKAVAVVALVTVSLLPGCIDVPGPTPEFVSYNVSLTSNGPAAAVVPLPVLSEVVDRIKVDGGDGGFEFLETERGRCMRLWTDRHLEVKGVWSPKGDAEFKLMTINLTTMVPNETAPYSFVNEKPPDRTIWVELPSAGNGSLWLSCSMKNPYGKYFEFEYRTQLAGLVLGWNEGLAIGSTYVEDD